MYNFFLDDRVIPFPLTSLLICFFDRERPGRLVCLIGQALRLAPILGWPIMQTLKPGLYDVIIAPNPPSMLHARFIAPQVHQSAFPFPQQSAKIQRKKGERLKERMGLKATERGKFTRYSTIPVAPCSLRCGLLEKLRHKSPPLLKCGNFLSVPFFDATKSTRGATAEMHKSHASCKLS